MVVKSVDLEMVERWQHKLSVLQDEMEKAYGDPSPGSYDDKLPTLVRFAWEAAADEAQFLRNKSDMQI